MNTDNDLSTNGGALINVRQQEHRRFLILILALLCLAIAIENTHYVGDLTIYHDTNAGTILAVHYAILNNAMPDGGWAANGSNGTNVRILTIHLAETIHDLTGSDLPEVYRFMDLVFIAITLFFSFLFFNSFTSTSTAVIGLLYLAWILPLTYAFHNFHPWDRIGWLTWLLAIWAIKDHKPYALAVILVLGITIKYDILALAGLYFLVWVNGTNWRRVTAGTTVISLVGIATFALLVYCLPGGFDAERNTSLVFRVKRIYWELCSHPVDHPVLLAFTSLFCVAPMGLRSRNRFAITSFLYGVFLLLIVAWRAVFLEIRAQMGIMLLLMPLVLIALDRIFRSENERRAALRQHDSAVPQSVG